jgi:hypothetical protein
VISRHLIPTHSFGVVLLNTSAGGVRQTCLKLSLAIARLRPAQDLLDVMSRFRQLVECRISFGGCFGPGGEGRKQQQHGTNPSAHNQTPGWKIQLLAVRAKHYLHVNVKSSTTEQA